MGLVGRLAVVGGATLLPGWLAGCGGAPPPVEQLASAQAEIKGAQEIGAAEDPKAKLHVKLAQEQLDRAKQLMADGDNEQATLLLLRAEADAQLAHALAKLRSTGQAAAEAVHDVHELQGTK